MDRNNDYIRYVGYSDDYLSTPLYFSNTNIGRIGSEVSTRLWKAYKLYIVVPTDKILNVMNNVYLNRRPQIGDIHSRFIIKGDRDDLGYMNEYVIDTIYNHISNEIDTNRNNNKLSIWNTVYGDFNQAGLRQHPPIKLRQKTLNRRGTVSFMNY